MPRISSFSDRINMIFPRTVFLSLSLAAALLLSSGTASNAAEKFRSCSVKEVLKGGIYVYLRCQENEKDIWLATVARDFKTDEVISFVNAPPMNDFYSKYLDRTFPEVIFTDLLPPEKNK
jgi:hypothetical protein